LGNEFSYLVSGLGLALPFQETYCPVQPGSQCLGQSHNGINQLPLIAFVWRGHPQGFLWDRLSLDLKERVSAVPLVKEMFFGFNNARELFGDGNPLQRGGRVKRDVKWWMSMIKVVHIHV
jgi:hypothetical protein